MIWYWSHEERGEQHLNAQEVLDDLTEFNKTRLDGDNPRLALTETVERFCAADGMADVVALKPTA